MRSTASSSSRAARTPGGKAGSGAAAVLAGVGIAALVAGAAYLLQTNPATGRWEQVYNPAGSWGLSTALAALPVIVLLGAMAIFRLKAHVAAALGLGTALVVALAVFHMPARLALTTTVFGAAYGIFPIC